MEQWHTLESREIDAPEIDAFLADIEAVCRKHGLSISHEDGHGGFLIEKFNEETMQWLHAASDGRK